MRRPVTQRSNGLRSEGGLGSPVREICTPGSKWGDEYKESCRLGEATVSKETDWQGSAKATALRLVPTRHRVNHDKLMGQVAKRIEDKRLLKLIRAFLNAGVMENGLVSPSVEGTPQGGPLSPLLSNLVLDELDRELERRGHRYLRYADDCKIYVRSQGAVQRVMKGVTRFITHKLKLKVNEAKSAVARPPERKLLGFMLSAAPTLH